MNYKLLSYNSQQKLGDKPDSACHPREIITIIQFLKAMSTDSWDIKYSMAQVSYSAPPQHLYDYLSSTLNK